MIKPMTITEAAEVIIRDLCGWCDSRFSDAYLRLAYAEPEELEETDLEVDQTSMQLNVATIIAKYTDTTPELVAAKFQTEPEVKAYAMLYMVPITIELVEQCSLRSAPITNYGVALEVIARNQAEAPKYQEAYDWLIDKGDDVPAEVREAMTASIDEQLAMLGVPCEKDANGEPIYSQEDIIKALS